MKHYINFNFQTTRLFNDLATLLGTIIIINDCQHKRYITQEELFYLLLVAFIDFIDQTINFTQSATYSTNYNITNTASHPTNAAHYISMLII